MSRAGMEAWQACAEEKDKRIAELETALDNCHDQMANNALKIIELTAQNKELVEALEACNESMHECAVSDLNSDRLAYKFMDARKLADEALAKVKGL